MARPATAARRASPRGAVTAETALVLPLLLAVTAALLWLLAVGAAQVRAVDAAREGARAAARGEEPALVHDVTARAAPEGSSITVGGDTRTVVVTVRADVAAPAGPFARWLPAVTVSAAASAAREGP